MEETSGGSLVKIHKKFGLKITPVIKIISPIVNFFDNFFKFLNIRKNLTIKNIYKKLDKRGIDKNKVIFLDHHFCHAIGSFHASEFNNALIITCDGKEMMLAINHLLETLIKRAKEKLNYLQNPKILTQ